MLIDNYKASSYNCSV